MISNISWLDYRLLTGISKFIDAKCPNCVVTVTGYASVQGVTASNNKLGKLGLNILSLR
jgi:hypothetical protein